MNSILNSISPGNLQVQHVPEEKSVKKDSIIELLSRSEIEFKPEIKEEQPKLEFEILHKPEPPEEEEVEIENLLQNNKVDCSYSDTTEEFNTGFGADKDLHYEDNCEIKLKVPLYKENYLQEFNTEEEKASARHALGLYNKEDIVALSMLTAEDQIPSRQELLNATIKQLRKGDNFFAPVTLFNAVFDTSGNTLNSRLKNIDLEILEQKRELAKILQTTSENNISSLGDVQIFLQGFNNGEKLKTILDNREKEFLKFEKTGQITK